MHIETLIIRIFCLPSIVCGTWLMIRILGAHRPSPPTIAKPEPPPFEIAQPVPNDEDFNNYYRVNGDTVTRGRLEKI